MLCPSVFMKTDHLWNHTTIVKIMKKSCKLLHHSMRERNFQSSNIKDNEGKIIAGNRTVGDSEIWRAMEAHLERILWPERFI